MDLLVNFHTHTDFSDGEISPEALAAGLAAIQAGRSPTNLIHPGRLGYIQQELLKQAFAQIAAVQKKISYDFLGGT